MEPCEKAVLAKTQSWDRKEVVGKTVTVLGLLKSTRKQKVEETELVRERERWQGKL